MARFLFVNQHYWPESFSTGQHLTDLAEHLAAHGHEVRVLCARTASSSRAREERRGVRIRRLRTSRFGRGRLSGRLADFASFHLGVSARLVCERWADVVVTLTTPPLLGFWGSLGERLGGPRHVMFLMDHHPDAEFELGLLDRDSLIGRGLEAVYGWSLRQAERCVTLGPYQAERAARRRVEAARLEIIPIWSRADELQPVPHDENRLRAELGWRDRFVVLYSGNAGIVHRFDELLEAMTILNEQDPSCLFAFVGGGARRGEIRAHVERHRLANTCFHDSVPRARLGELLSAADLHFVSLRPEHVGVSVPGKLYGQLASARPVAFVGPRDCETADDVRAAGAGLTLLPGQGPQLAREIAQLGSDAERCAALGARGRAWFLENREHALSCERWRGLLESLASKKSAARIGQTHDNRTAA